MERAGWIYTPSSKSQKSAAGEGAGRPSGGGGGDWTELGVASGGFRTVRLSCSRPVGAVPGPPASGLWAPSPVSQSQELLSGLNCWHCQRSPSVKAQASGRHTEGSGFMQANFLRLVHRNSCWYLTASVPASLWHDQISVRWRKNTQWTLIHCFFSLFSQMTPVCKTKTPHTHLCHSIPYSSGPYRIRIRKKHFHDAPLHQLPAGVSVKHSLHKFAAPRHDITHLRPGVVEYVTTN